jgi:hypothetical protein
MWYTMTFDGRPAIMFYDGESRSIHFADDVDNPTHKVYEEWVEAGNESEPWQPEAVAG